MNKKTPRVRKPKKEKTETQPKQENTSNDTKEIRYTFGEAISIIAGKKPVRVKSK